MTSDSQLVPRPASAFRSSAESIQSRDSPSRGAVSASGRTRLATPCTANWEKHKLWDEDPVMAPYKVAAKLGQAPGFAGPPNAKAAEVWTKYIVTDIYAKAVQGMPAEEAVRWAEGELKKIYA